MGGARVDEEGRGELMDVAESLHGRRVNHLSFVRVGADERVDRIAELVLLLGHPVPLATNRCSLTVTSVNG